MGKHLGIGFLMAFIILSFCVLCLSYDLADFNLCSCMIVALFFGTIATCTSMILEKLDTIIELTAAQSAKLRSLESKSVDIKSPSDN